MKDFQAGREASNFKREQPDLLDKKLQNFWLFGLSG
jgi:hypothetical protein